MTDLSSIEFPHLRKLAMRQFVIPGALSLALAGPAFVSLIGCADGGWGTRSRSLPPEPIPQPERPPDLILKDTIGDKIVLSGAGPLHVRGFGLVVGLGEKGTTECPAALRDYLIERLTKDYDLDAVAGNRDGFSATKLVDSMDTAAVEVDALIPAGSPSRSHFDVYVRAPDGTQTRSLEGGLLLPCQLKIVDLSYRGDRLIAGRDVGRAGGPVFTNPYVTEDKAGASDPRRGFILGGGVSFEPRNIRLVLSNPSYADTRRIEFRINERFGQSPKTAEAMGEGHVEVRTPAGYEDDPMRFIRLLSHVYLFNNQTFYEEKLRELAEMADWPNPPYEDLALAFEGIGRIGIDRIQPLYGHANRETSFAAAQAGLRLGDYKALGVMGEISKDAAHPRRLDAVYELGRTNLSRAAGFLVPLLDGDDPQVRIAAYLALLKHRHPAVQTETIPSVLNPDEVNFALDTVSSSGKPLIYIRRTREPRIAVFGRRTPVHTPMFYTHPDGWVTLNALEATDDITLFRRTSRTGRLSDALQVAPLLNDLIVSMADLPIKNQTGRIRGVGLGYSQVVYVLHALGRENIIPGTIVVEASGLREQIEKGATPERLEGDFPAAQIDDADAPRQVRSEGSPS